MTYRVFTLSFRDFFGVAAAHLSRDQRVADVQLELAFGESGVWDAILLLVFDRIFRSAVVYSLLPLSETRQSEQAFNHIRAATYSLVFSYPVRSTSFGYFFNLLQPFVAVAWVFFFILFISLGF